MKQQIPFISGAQYYRAPTPDSKHWASDLELMRDLKFNSVKFWVQWRWSHRQEDEFYFSDLDQLMDLALKQASGNSEYNIRRSTAVAFRKIS